MNDELLAQQLAKTGNLLDLLNDEAWLDETDAIEAKCGGQVEAGADLKPYVNLLATVGPEQFRQQRRQVEVLSILLPELKNWLKSWQLGLSFDAVYVEARRRLFSHIQQPTAEEAAWIEALLVEEAQRPAPEQKTVRSQAIAMLSRMLTDDDWQALAKTAAEATATGILRVRHHHEVATSVA